MKLYIVMREDLWDMNPGKGMAQAAHAQADFDDYSCNINDNDFWLALINWKEGRSFGTTLVLHEPIEKMNEIKANMAHCKFTTDPTYPYRNHYGKVFVRNEITCMWVFAYTESELEYMSQFKLHP